MYNSTYSPGIHDNIRLMQGLFQHIASGGANR